MEFLMALGAGSAVVLAGIVWRHSRGRSHAATPRSVKELNTLIAWEPQATRVLTGAERLAFVTLSRALPEYIVLAQVPLARFIRVPTRHSYTEWLRRVGQLCPDLLVCDASSQVVAVVEVRPPEEQSSPRARRRLERMSRVLKGAGIPMQVWPESSLPSPEAAREAVLAQIESGAPQAPISVPSAVPPSVKQAAGVMEAPRAAPAAPVAARPITLDIEPDEVIEMREPPPSTWFDDIDSGPTPLRGEKATATLR
jgi:hypothetical protein